MVAGIDVGLKRIGLALLISDIVIPQNPIIRKSREQASKELKEFLNSWNVETIIVGIPIGGSSEEIMSYRIKHFINLLDFKGEIVYIDESFSSIEAKESLKGYKRDKRDGKIDSLSAKIIVERWLGR